MKHDEIRDAATQRAAAEQAGQGHLFTFWDQLDEQGKDRLLRQLATLDLAGLPALVEQVVRKEMPFQVPTRLEPARVRPLVPSTVAEQERYDRARALGLAALRAGQVGASVVAGGQGSRLGYEGPKGFFPIAPVTGKPLFRLFAEQLLGAQQRYSCRIPWYVMTSPQNDAVTRAFFGEHRFFGLDPDQVVFYSQGTMPAFDLQGRILLAAPDELALSPDGHGGALLALRRSGALADMARRGVRYLSHFQIDNPLLQVVDPLFLGLHVLEQSEWSAKCMPKVADTERVGNFCLVDGVLGMIEYSDLPEELAHARNPDGSRRFDAGNPAIFVISCSFIEKITGGEGSTDPHVSGGFSLPWHRAVKKVPHLDLSSGQLVQPEKPNAIKLEAFIFDAIPLAKNPVVLETRREEEFSPVKNAEGVDSVVSCRRDLLRRAARWLRQAGVEVPDSPDGEPDWRVEIDGRYALDAAQLAERLQQERVRLEEPLLRLPAGCAAVLGRR